LTGAAAEQDFGTWVAGVVGQIAESLAAETLVVAAAGQAAAVETWAAAAAAGCSVLGFQAQQTL